jgi:hypothetical protein
MTFAMDNEGTYAINNLFIAPDIVYKPTLTLLFIPEPSTLVFAAFGVVALAACCRGHRKSMRVDRLPK